MSQMSRETPDTVKAKIIADALCQLARAGASYEFFMSKMFWGLSLFLENGSFQVQNFPKWHRKSDAAIALQRNVPLLEWKKTIRFEHARPLREMYAIAQSEADRLSAGDLLRIVGEYPPVIVTKEEDTLIAGRYRSSGHPEDRYENIRLSFPLRSDQWKTYSWLDVA